jgi:small-conductance mechanosensitive channel
MSDKGEKEEFNENLSDTSEYHNVGPYVKTPSPPMPIRDVTTPITPADTDDAMSTTSSVSSRLGHLEDQRRLHSQARQAQAARNSITSITSAQSRESTQTSVDKPIRNSPHEEDEYADEKEVEKVLDSEMVSDEEISARDLGALVKAAYFDLCIVLPIMFLPTILLYFMVDDHSYNISTMKNVLYMNPTMECIRYNIFATIAYGLYVIYDVLSLVVPEAILLFTPVSKDSDKNVATRFIRSQVQLLINVRKHVAMSAWLITLIPLASIFLYESMFVTPWDVVAKLAEAKADKAVNSATTKIEQDELLADGKNSMIQRNIEIALVLLAIFSSVLAVEKYLMQMIALNFHRMAFAERISDVNKRFGFLLKLYEAVKFGKPRVLSASTINLMDIDSSTDLSMDKGLHLTSVHRAKSVSKLIFRTLMPTEPGRDHLLVQDFEKWTNAPKETFAAFDLNGSDKLTEDELEESIIDIFNSRENVSRGLKSNGKIVKKLDNLFIIVALSIGAVLATPIFDVGASKLFMSIGVMSTGLGFLFHSTAKSCFESILFVFIQHPFDVGDRVIIDDETFIVEDVEVFTTKMIRWDGVVVYITNSSLCSKTIQNIRRSENQLESLNLKIKGDSPTESLWTFRQELKKELKSHYYNFTGEVDLANLDKLPSSDEPLSLTVLAQVRGNFQNSAKRNARKSEFLEIVEKALQNSNLTKA